jgi:predicted metal-binding protein
LDLFAIIVDRTERETYQHANDRDQEDDLNQTVEDKEDTANHFVGWNEGFDLRSMECLANCHSALSCTSDVQRRVGYTSTQGTDVARVCSMHGVRDAKKDKEQREAKKDKK